MDINVGDKITLAAGVSGIVAGVRVKEDSVSVLVGSPHGDWINAAGAVVEPAVIAEAVETAEEPGAEATGEPQAEATHDGAADQ